MSSIDVLQHVLCSVHSIDSFSMILLCHAIPVVFYIMNFVQDLNKIICEKLKRNF